MKDALLQLACWVFLPCLLLTALSGDGGTGTDTGIQPANPSLTPFQSRSEHTPALPDIAPDVVPARMPMAATRSVAAGSCPVSQQLAQAQHDGLRVAGVHWLQVVSQAGDDPDTVLAGEKAVRVRVDVLADKAGVAAVEPRLHVYDPRNRHCQSIALHGPATYPQSIDSLTLKTAYVADLPADLVRTDMAVVVAVASASGRSEAEADKTYIELKPRVVAAVHEQVYFIPLTLGGQTGRIDVTPAEAASLLSRLFPYSTVTAHIDVPLDIPAVPASALQDHGGLTVFDFDNDVKIMKELQARCQHFNPEHLPAYRAPKCVGMLPDGVRAASFDEGQLTGLIGGWTMEKASWSALIGPSLTQVDDHSVVSPDSGRAWLASAANTVAHEYGHLLGLGHAACGAKASGQKLHDKGTLGLGMGAAGTGSAGAGYDNVRDFYFSAASKKSNGSPRFHDLMSYCHLPWMSDRGYRQAIAYLATGKTPTRIHDLQAQVKLKLWERPAGWRFEVVEGIPDNLVSVSSYFKLEAVGRHGESASVLLQAEPGEQTTGPFYATVPVARERYALRSWSGELLLDWKVN